MMKIPKGFLNLWVHPSLFYELLIVAAALAIAGVVAHLFRKRTHDRHEWHRAGLRRLAYPLTGLAVLGVCHFCLAELTDWPLKLIDVGMQLLLALACVRMVIFALRRASSPSSWLASFEKTLVWFIWIVVALNILGLLPTLIKELDSFSLDVGKGSRLTLWGVMHGAVIVLGTVIAALWISNAMESRLMRASTLDTSLKVVMTRLSKALLLILAILTGMSLAGLDITMLSVFGGALGVGLGFGMQKIASNYVSGFIILLDRSIRIGNIIQINNPEQRGVVTQITTRYTVVRALNGIHFIVPNETLVSSVVQNETYADTRARASLRIQVGYNADVDRAIAIMEELACAQPRVIANPAPSALLVSFDDSGINLELGWWVSDPENGTGGIRSNIGRAILRRFREEKIEIPFPQREVRIVGELPATQFPLADRAI